MHHTDTDPGMEDEARENERWEADFEQAQMEAAGNAMHRARKRGICTHGSSVGWVPKPVYYPEQEGLKRGQVACTEHTAGCNAVFESDADWCRAIKEAVNS